MLKTAALLISALISSLALGAEPEPSKAPPSALRKSELISVTKVVGEVGEHFVTSREVRINDGVDKALYGAGDKLALLSGQEKTFPTSVGKVLDEWAIYYEAKSLSSTEASKEEVDTAVSNVKSHWDQNAGWLKLEVANDELRSMIVRKLVANSFSRLKTDPQLSPISDDEALSYYRKNRLRFGSLPFSSFKENIKSYLIKTQTEKRMSEWHEVLRRKYRVRNFISG
jgi:hypothetical protein